MATIEYVVIPFSGEAVPALERITRELGFIGAVVPAFEELTEAFYVAFLDAEAKL